MGNDLTMIHTTHDAEIRSCGDDSPYQPSRLAGHIWGVWEDRRDGAWQNPLDELCWYEKTEKTIYVSICVSIYLSFHPSIHPYIYIYIYHYISIFLANVI